MILRRNTAWSRLSLAVATVIFASLAPQPVRADEEPDTSEAEETSAQGQVHHQIDYIEISVKDMAEAKRFYGEAFGWQFNDYGPEYAGIRKAGGGEVGGLSQTSEVTTGGPLVILYSENLEKTVAGVESAGGRIVKKPFSFPGGRRFHFTDPSGNELAVWSDK